MRQNHPDRLIPRTGVDAIGADYSRAPEDRPPIAAPPGRSVETYYVMSGFTGFGEPFNGAWHPTGSRFDGQPMWWNAPYGYFSSVLFIWWCSDLAEYVGNDPGGVTFPSSAWVISPYKESEAAGPDPRRIPLPINDGDAMNRGTCFITQYEPLCDTWAFGPSSSAGPVGAWTAHNGSHFFEATETGGTLAAV